MYKKELASIRIVKYCVLSHTMYTSIPVTAGFFVDFFGCTAVVGFLDLSFLSPLSPADAFPVTVFFSLLLGAITTDHVLARKTPIAHA